MKSAILKLGVAMLAIVLLGGMWFSVQPASALQEIRATGAWCMVVLPDGKSREGCDYCPSGSTCIDCLVKPC